MPTSLLRRKQTHFVLWRPGKSNPGPRLVIGTYQPGTPSSLAGERSLPLAVSTLGPDVFEIAASDCGLTEGRIYHYWFEVDDTNAYTDSHGRLRVTDPTAGSVDWRLTFVFPAPYNPNANAPTENEAPAAVVRFENGKLRPADPQGQDATFETVPDFPMSHLPPNNRLVIYELPTAWTKTGDLLDAQHVGVGSFRDVVALLEKFQPGGNFADVAAVSDRAHLVDLGVNALELLPPADSYLDRRSWGYGTSNYFAPDFDLGRPLDPNDTAAVNAAKAPTALGDFFDLIRACHKNGIRFFYDAVMAFAKQDPYRFANFADFHIAWGRGDPEQGNRNGFGGDLWKYAWDPQGYDPVTGAASGRPFLARRHMLAHLLHWIGAFHIDGLRLDSVNNYGNWDFAGDVRATARAAWNDRWTTENNPVGGADERFLVIGEELSVPKDLLSRLDALWNERFKQILRRVILGRSEDGRSFEDSVRRLIDCRNLGFSDGAQAVNYIGSHDVGGFANERFYNYLGNNGVVLKEKQIKLAFACLLTAVGIPMILAGDEFAEESNFKQCTDANKEIDPINFEHLQEPWRKGVFDYVARLVKFRTTSDALSVNEIDFIHVDFSEGKRILVWKRGRAGIDAPVVVVANFSDWGTENPRDPASHYDVPNWPATPAGAPWREVSQGYNVDPGRAGREPIFPWEAKVYTIG